MSSTNVNSDKGSNGAQASAMLERLGRHDAMQRVRPASLFNLNVALLALQAEGVGGTLTIRIPAKAGGQVEIEYSSLSYA